MKLYIKQGEVSWSSFLVFDKIGMVKYRVMCAHSSTGMCFRICNTNNLEIAKIKCKKLNFLSIYNIILSRSIINIIFTVGITKPVLHIIGTGLEFKGDIISKEFSLVKDSNIMMNHKKVWLQDRFYYELDLLDTRKEIECLCIAICVDSILIDEGFSKLALN